MADGDLLWDVQALDHWIDGMKGEKLDVAEEALRRLGCQ
jgi:hypothetical protein